MREQSFTLAIAAIHVCGLRTISAFHSSVSSTFIIRSTSPVITTFLSSEEADNGDNDEPKLYVGENVQKAIEALSSQSGIMEASRKRNDMARLKVQEEARREEEENRERMKRLEEGGDGNGDEKNYGPGDMSSFKGFANDGFVASAGNDDQLKWSESNKKAAIEEEPSSLFLYGDDDLDGESGSGLII